MANVINQSAPYQYLQFVNTPDYDPNVWVINPDLSGVVGVEQKYWKVVSGAVVEMTSDEKAAVDAALIAKTILNGKYKVSAFTNGLLATESWYAVDNGDGTYSNLVTQFTYSYSGSSVTSRTEITYFADATISSSNTFNYFTNNSGATQIEKQV